MTPREHVPLSSLTTFKVGGPARYLAECRTEDDVREAVRFAHSHDLPFYPLGEGSNVLPSDQGFRGLIMHIKIEGITREEQDTETLITAGAGVHWDTLVEEAGKRSLWGIENLAGIPGTVGAAPVQNIGAYGADLADTLVNVVAFDAATGAVITIPKEECRLRYRDSRFKHEPNLIILSVTLALSHKPSPKLHYGDLKALEDAGENLSSSKLIAEAVRKVRKDKFPDLALNGTAGSFFKNPILTKEVYDELAKKHGDIPTFPNPDGVKIPLAFVLDKVLKLRGFRRGRVWLFGRQPLVIVSDAGAKAEEIDALANYIATRVKEATNISIEREVRTLDR